MREDFGSHTEQDAGNFEWAQTPDADAPDPADAGPEWAVPTAPTGPAPAGWELPPRPPQVGEWNGSYS